jgi:HD-GYP domain-containing protein (c-di-GMP phosphodiesterase class II)
MSSATALGIRGTALTLGKGGCDVLRLADLLAGLSQAADLGFGLEPGEAVRSSALALLVGRSAGFPDDELRAGMYGALLLHLGCIGYSHETARLFGDELAHNAAVARTNIADPKDVFTSFMPALLHGRPPLEQIRLGFNALTRGQRFGRAYETAACEIGRDAARRLGLPGAVERAVYHSYEQWNGGGVPHRLTGDEIPAGSRLSMLASVAALFHSLGGSEAATAAVRAQAGSILDPGLVDHFATRAYPLLAELDAVDPYAFVLDAEPEPTVRVADSQLPAVAAVFGDVVDVKSPYTQGHARGVAGLARRAGEHVGLTADEVDGLHVAALLHDVGRVAISNRVWDKPGPLSAHEWEQVRLHGYHSERILARSGPLAVLAPIVGAHHERLDGSGYHRSCAGVELGMAARVLAAADAYQAMGEERPHRAALRPEQAEQQLVDDARAGRLDADAVTAVLAVAGHDAVAERTVPAGLTDREVEVVRLVARGCSNRQVAEQLVISRRTAEHHVQHIYTKVGVSNRASLALFAIEHGLLRRPG